MYVYVNFTEDARVLKSEKGEGIVQLGLEEEQGFVRTGRRNRRGPMGSHGVPWEQMGSHVLGQRNIPGKGPEVWSCRLYLGPQSSPISIEQRVY